jgi:hypothetical protein
MMEVEAVPSWPNLPSPQHLTFPSLKMTQVNWLPPSIVAANSLPEDVVEPADSPVARVERVVANSATAMKGINRNNGLPLIRIEYTF